MYIYWIFIIYIYRSISIITMIIFLIVQITGFTIKYINLKSYAISNSYADVYIKASNACLIDTESNNVIFDKNMDEKIAPASTTKMITALTVLDYCHLDEEVIVGDEIDYIKDDASKAGLEKNNVLTIKQLLDGLLLPSGNDSAYVLARYTGEKIANANKEIKSDDAIFYFMKAINEKANKLGANNSKFIRPDGYDCRGQYSTVRDLACIAKAFTENNTLTKIVSTYKLNDIFLDGSTVIYENTNQLINPYSDYYYENIKGLKTGSSESAGKCVISNAFINDKEYICVVMGSTEEGRWLDSLSLYQYVN